MYDVRIINLPSVIASFVFTQQPGPLTDLQRLHCVCNHLSTFAGGVIPLPNAINLKEDILLFAELFENPVTTMTVLSVFSVFLLCAVWARRKDRREEKEVINIK